MGQAAGQGAWEPTRWVGRVVRAWVGQQRVRVAGQTTREVRVQASWPWRGGLASRNSLQNGWTRIFKSIKAVTCLFPFSLVKILNFNETHLLFFNYEFTYEFSMITIAFCHLIHT